MPMCPVDSWQYKPQQSDATCFQLQDKTEHEKQSLVRSNQSNATQHNQPDLLFMKLIYEGTSREECRIKNQVDLQQNKCRGRPIEEYLYI
jgi:hypothetical protein